MRKRLSGMIESLEGSRLPVAYSVVTFLALVTARNLLEGAMGPQGALGFVYFSSPSALMVLDHFLFFYTSLFLGLALALSLLARERVGRVVRVMTPAWALVLLPPVLDFALSGGEGYHIAYLLDLRPAFLRFFDPSATLDSVSPGQRVEILGACLLAAAYVRLKARSWIRAAAAFVTVYVIIAAHGALPGALARLVWAISRAASAAPDFVYHAAFKSGGIVPDESRKLALVFLFTSTALGWSVFRRHAPRKARVVLLNARPLRALHYVGLTTFGIALGWAIFSPAGVAVGGAGDVLGVLGTCFATLLAFRASVSLNDLTDEQGDRISRLSQPLVAGTLDRRDVSLHAIVFAVGAVVFALNVKYSTFVLVLLALAVSFCYSAPPLRLKRIPIVGGLTLGVASLLACMIGFSVFAEERTFALFPGRLAWLIVLSFGLGFLAKDIKDVAGDRATGVLTLPVLLGPRAGKAATAALVFAGYAAVPMLLPYRALVLPALLVGASSACMIYAWKGRRLVETLLAVCLAFTLVVAVVSLRGIDELVNDAATVTAAKAAELRGRRAGAWEDWATAAQDYAFAAAAFAEDPGVVRRAGTTALRNGQHDEARRWLARAADLDPADPIAVEYLALAERRAGLDAAAESLLRDAIRRGMRPGVFLALLGEHYMDVGDPASAGEAFAQALRLGRPDVPARLRLADALFTEGRTEEARRHYELALARNPSSGEAHDAMGRFARATGDLERSVAELRAAVGAAPDEPMLWNNLGAALRAAGAHGEALEALDEATKLAPRAAEPYYNRGLTFGALGRTNEARRQLLLALEIDPAFAPARKALADLEASSD